MQIDTSRSTLTIRQACELAQVSRRTLYNWLALGKVEHVRNAGGSVRIFADTLWQPGGKAHHADKGWGECPNTLNP